MSTSTAIQIFRPGRHTAMSGETLAFSDADVRASAEAYDPALHEAPIVIGHPRHDAPAYGWVESVRYADGALEARPHQVDPQFAEMVRAGRFKKVSASFYRPDAAGNPKPGTYYLRHVGFLGAQPPAVKGLKAVELGEGDEGVVTVELAEADGGIVREVFRRLREWLIRSADQDTADQVVPAWMVDEVERPEPPPAPEAPSSFSEPAGPPAPTPSADPSREDDVTQQSKEEIEAQRAELERREQELRQREAQFAEEAQRQRREQHAAAIDDLVSQGRVLPRDREPLVALFAELDDGETAQIEFAEDGGKPKKTAATEWLREFLARLPEQVDYSERAAGDRTAAAPGTVDAPAGYSVRPERAELHQRALAYAEQHQVDYLTAVRAVERG